MEFRHPTDIPRSNRLFFDWIGKRVPVATPQVKGDSYPLTWAADGGLYAGAGDPVWYADGGRSVALFPGTMAAQPIDMQRRTGGLVVEKFTGCPEALGIERVHDMPGFIGMGAYGPKPTGMISIDGRLYYAAQNMLGYKPPRFRENSQHGSDATIMMSEDYGKTWTPDWNVPLLELTEEFYDTPAISWKPGLAKALADRGWEPMFPGNLFGGPSFVQFGRDNADAVDGYVYAVSADHWDNGRDLRLGRVKKDSILDRAAWEFVSEVNDLNPVWDSDLNKSVPILSIDRHISTPEMVYVKSVHKYLLLTWGLHTDFRTPTGSELTILEANRPWGPFSLVHYEWMWHNTACCAYCPKLPLKWLEPESLEGHILYSGNWETNIPYYLPQTQKFRLSVRKDDLR